MLGACFSGVFLAGVTGFDLFGFSLSLLRGFLTALSLAVEPFRLRLGFAGDFLSGFLSDLDRVIGPFVLVLAVLVLVIVTKESAWSGVLHGSYSFLTLTCNIMCGFVECDACAKVVCPFQKILVVLHNVLSYPSHFGVHVVG